MIWFRNLWNKILNKNTEEIETSLNLKLIPQPVPIPLVGRGIVNLAEKSFKWAIILKRIRERELKRVGEHCEFCSSKSELIVHEKWEYDDIKHIQYLKGFNVSCKMCFSVNFLGFSSKKDLESGSLKHFMKVNDLNLKEAIKIIERAHNIWKKRSSYKDWRQDFLWLKERAHLYGITSEDVTEIYKTSTSTVSSEQFMFNVNYRKIELQNVPLINKGRLNLLKKIGITDVDSLLSFKPQELAENPILKSSGGFSLQKIQLIYNYARAIKEKIPIVVDKVPELEKTDISYFDLEYDPDKPFIFLIGIMEKTGQKMQWFIENEVEGEKALKEFLEASNGKNYLTYCGLTADVPTLIACLKKYGYKVNLAEEGHILEIFSEKVGQEVTRIRIIDLYYDIIRTKNPLKQKIFLPLNKFDLKTVAKYFDYAQNQEVRIHNGIEALVFFKKYLQSWNNVERSHLKHQLILYNEEDLRRMKYVFEKLRLLVNQEYMSAEAMMAYS